MKPDLTQLRTFVAVLQEGHLTRAAERLHISQPTASHHIRALEEHFGVALFNRNARGLEPTVAGQRLAQGAIRVLSASVELDGLARELQGSLTGRLTVRTVEEPGLLAQLAALMRWLREHHPLVELSLEGRNSRGVAQGMLAGELDAGFFVGSTLLQGMDGFEFDSLEFVLAGPWEWRERLAHASREDLAAMPWIITPANTSHGELAERLFRPHGLQIHAVLEVTNEVLLRSMVKGGVGIGFVRRKAAEADVASELLWTLPDTLSRTGLQFGFPSARKSDPMVQLLVAGLHAIGRGPIGP